jgi:Bacterial toxin homologue of phage lysozyme, C-term
MAGARRPGVIAGTQDEFDSGTLCLSQSPIPGPVCSTRLEDMIREAAALSQSGRRSIAKRNERKHRAHGGHRARFAKPDPKVMAEINRALGTRINFDKLADFEGGQRTHGYIPGHTPGVLNDGAKVLGQSGVTIATGFDIGQWHHSALTRSFDLPAALVRKFTPFCDRKKQRAVDAFEKAGGLVILKGQADVTDMHVQRFHLVAAIGSWDGDPKPSKRFVELTTAQQTVILSRTYHQGIGMPKTHVAKEFYTAAKRGDWMAAERALRNYDVKSRWYKIRVNAEADYLAQERRPATGAAAGAR